MIKVAIVDDDETMLEQARACIEGIDDLPEDVDIRTCLLYTSPSPRDRG